MPKQQLFKNTELSELRWGVSWGRNGENGSVRFHRPKKAVAAPSGSEPGAPRGAWCGKTEPTPKTPKPIKLGQKDVITG